MAVNKHFKSESRELKRSEVQFADYNPRTLSAEERKTLKAGIKRFGMVGGLIANLRTGMTLVGGHQRLSVLDELNKYDPQDPTTDYNIRVDVVDLDEKSEKELNILLNNPNAQGKWDNDALARMLPDIDYSYAGLTDADLAIMGIDYEVPTDLYDEGEGVDSFFDTSAPNGSLVQQAQETVQRGTKSHLPDVEAIKSRKEAIREQAHSTVENMDAYVVLSFATYSAKMAFLSRFGYDPHNRYINGDEFNDEVERVFE